MLASLLVMPAWANGSWRVVLETSAEVVAIDLSSFQRSAGRISFRERSTLSGDQTAPHSLRPMSEILAKRMIDCQTRQIATRRVRYFPTTMRWSITWRRMRAMPNGSRLKRTNPYSGWCAN